jgi:hypothetical protein
MPSESTNSGRESTDIIVVSKSGKLNVVNVETKTFVGIKELTELLSKKCGNIKSTGFSWYHTYKFRNKRRNILQHSDSKDIPKYIYIDVWGKTDGRSGEENKYELPPPIDELLFFGKIALVARINKEISCSLNVDRWNIIYERLFGGFEDLAATAKEDENEIDELDLVPASKKTKNGYLRDGFVVDDDEVTSSSSDKSVKRNKHSKKGKGNDESESEFETETDTESLSFDSKECCESSEQETDKEEKNEIIKPKVQSKSRKIVDTTEKKPKKTITKKSTKKENIQVHNNNDDDYNEDEDDAELEEEEYE